MKQMRKLTSLLLVLAMSLVLAIPCFAASPEPTASSVPTISLDGKKPGDKVVVGDFTIEIIDAEQFYALAKTRAYIIQNSHYTSAANGSFSWNCINNPTLALSTDCASSKTDVKCVFDASPIGIITDTVAEKTANFWTITYTGSSILSQTVYFSFEPVYSDKVMDVYFTAREY